MPESDRRNTFDVPPSAIQRWQWEESINGLRRNAEESAIRTHWQTTGETTIDATARAHLAEWLCIDVEGKTPGPSLSIIDALVHRALHDEPWDLYVVEHLEGSSMAVRRLRDQRGVSVRWLEGRTPPPPDTTVALRLVHLDPPGVWASTLPLTFGDRIGSDDLFGALLRSFGAHDFSRWTDFMRGPGARILLEYTLSHLHARAASGESRPFDDRLRTLDRAFSALETALLRSAASPENEIVLDDGRVAWVEDITDSPHLLIFEGIGDLRRYRRLVRGGRGSPSALRRVPRCRLHRAAPTQLSDLDYALGALAGLRPRRHGLVRLERRDARGHRVDPRHADFRAAVAACRRLTPDERRRAA